MSTQNLSQSCFPCLILSSAIAILVGSAAPCQAQTRGVVPGTGTLIPFVGDTFEDPEWGFIQNNPKSSREQDEQSRFPRGVSTNRRWYEGPERGHPDAMQVIPTPQGGIEGSEYALQVRTLRSGIPGRRTNKVQQDDLIVDCTSRIGKIPVSEVPNVVVRVHLPEPDMWENRSGPHFGFRTTTTTTKLTQNESRSRWRTRSSTVRELEQYWPGIWVHFRSKTDQKFDTDSAYLTVRGNRMGRDFKVRDIPVEEFGWWTMGMSVTPDGMVHYYAHPGVEDLTAADHLTSQYPYSYRAENFETMFFNFCNRDDGRSWSTPFTIDEPQLYLLRAKRVNSIVERKQRAMQQQAQRRATQKTASKRSKSTGR